MKSVSNIKKITRTMEMVSVAKMKRSSDAAHAYRSFISSALEILNSIHRDSYLRHPFIKKGIFSFGEENKIKNKNILIIIGANKGLCGGYNTQLYKAVSKYFFEKKIENKNSDISESKDNDVSVISIGKYGEKIAKKFTNDIFLSYAKNSISNIDASVITKEIISRYMDKANPSDTVTVIHPHITSGVSYTTKTLQILPFGIDATPTPNPFHKGSGNIQNTSFTYEPTSELVIESVIPLVIEAVIVSAARETEAGEHAARMMAMKTATDNAGDMLDDLKLTYNNARQAKITQEIAELSSVA